MTKTIADLCNFATGHAARERHSTPVDRLAKGTPEHTNALHFEVNNRFFAGEWEVLAHTHKTYVTFEERTP